VRGHNEGSIFRHRKTGLWCACISIGLRQSGRPNRKYIYAKTQKEALQRLQSIRIKIAEGRLDDAEHLTVAAFLQWWLDNVAEPNFRFCSWRYYKGLANNYVIPNIGGCKLTQLTPEDVDVMLLTLKDQKTHPVSPRLRQQVYDFLKKVVNTALKRGIIPKNVCDAIDRPRVPKAEIEPLDEIQADMLLNVAKGDRFYALYLLVLNSGLRWGEVAGLRWKDVNTNDSMISLQRAIITAKVADKTGIRKERPLLAETKSRRGRHIAIPEFVVEALRQHQKRMMAEGHLAYIFCDTKGGPLRKSNFTRRDFKPLLERTNVQLAANSKLPNRFRFHDLRHTHATFLLKAGVHPKIVSERLGHATVAITLDFYSHVVPSMQRPAVDAMNILFSKGSERRTAATSTLGKPS